MHTQPRSLQTCWPQESTQHRAEGCPKVPSLPLARCVGAALPPNTAEPAQLTLRQQALLCETGKKAQEQELLCFAPASTVSAG